MRKLLLAGALALAALGAAACSGCTVLSNERAVLEDTALDEKALYAAEAAFYGATAAAEAAVDVELILPGDRVAVQIADGLDTAHSALLAARAAYEVGDAKTYAQKAAAVQGLVADVWALIPQKGAN